MFFFHYNSIFNNISIQSVVMHAVSGNFPLIRVPLTSEVNSLSTTHAVQWRLDRSELRCSDACHGVLPK